MKKCWLKKKQSPNFSRNQNKAEVADRREIPTVFVGDRLYLIAEQAKFKERQVEMGRAPGKRQQ